MPLPMMATGMGVAVMVSGRVTVLCLTKIYVIDYDSEETCLDQVYSRAMPQDPDSVVSLYSQVQQLTLRLKPEMRHIMDDRHATSAEGPRCDIVS